MVQTEIASAQLVPSPRDDELPFMACLIDAFESWIDAGGCYIQHLLTNKTEPLVLKSLQRRLLAEMRSQAMRRVPIRIVGLKSRKGGFSTLVQAFWYFWVKNFPDVYCMTLAHTDPSTKDLFRLATRISAKDPDFADREVLEKTTRGRPKKIKGDDVPTRPKNNAKEIEFQHHQSVFAVRTGGGHYVGSSATIHGLHISELSKYEGSEVVVRDQMDSLFGSVPDHTDTVIIIESTANESDTSGEFERRFKYAVANPGGTESGGFASFFAGWNEEPAYTKVGPVGGKGLDLDEEEQLLRDTYNLTNGQIWWRRWKIKTSFSGDTLRFKREFPISQDEAFQHARGKIFPSLRYDKNHFSAPTENLVTAGFHLYRGIDFGGADPFVCVWIAYKPGQPRFTVDTHLCPQTWRELTSYKYDKNNRIQDANNHSVDPVRYVIMHFGMTGHVHIFRELYLPDSAAQGIDITHLAGMVRDMSVGESIEMTIADRSRPDSILLLCNQNVPACAFESADAVKLGEIADGIMRMNSLMMATVPLVDLPVPDPEALQAIRRRQNSEFQYGHAAGELSVAMAEYEYARGGQGDGDPIFGGAFL